MWKVLTFALLGLFCARGDEVPLSQHSLESPSEYSDPTPKENYEGPVATGASKFGVHVERVDLTACPNLKNYVSSFYTTVIVNSSGFRERFRSFRLSFANQDPYGNVIGSTFGVEIPTSYTSWYHTWDAVRLMAGGADIRKQRPPVLNLGLWFGMPQIYIPLWLEGQKSGDLYWMLHIYPEEAMLGYPKTSVFQNGVLWSWPDQWGRLFHIKIDIASMIEELMKTESLAYEVANYTRFYESWGNVYIDEVEAQHPAFRDVEKISLRPSVSGGGTEYICSGSLKTLAYSWADFQRLVKAEYKWL